MSVNGWRDGLKQVLGACGRHRVWASLAVLLLLVGAIVCTDITWSHLGVLAQFLVAGIALGGYWLSYGIYREQERHKYQVAVVALFHETQERGNVRRQLAPGFSLRAEGRNGVLDARFDIQNISESPAVDIRMNMYLHKYHQGNSENPRPIFGQDIVLADGIAMNSREPYEQTIRPWRVREVVSVCGPLGRSSAEEPGRNWPLLFLAVIPRQGEAVSLSAWSLVFKYKNLLGERFFSVYKWERPVDREESSRLALYGVFAGDYLKDDAAHQFIKNRGFAKKESAPDWSDVEAALDKAQQEANEFVRKACAE